MSRDRDRSKPFTREEFEAIEAQAIAEGDQLTEQMAAVLIDTEAAFEKQRVIHEVLTDRIKAAYALGQYAKEDSIIGRTFSELKSLVDGLTSGELDPQLVSINWEHGTPFEMKFRTNWASMVVAAGLADSLRKEDGDYWNHITMVMHYHGEQFEVTVQRKSGKTPKELLDETRAQLALAEAVVEAARSDANGNMNEDRLDKALTAYEAARGAK